MSKKNKSVNENYSFAYSTQSSYNPFEALKGLTSDSQEEESSRTEIIELHFQRKGRNGKPVTLVRGLAEEELQVHAKALKNLCGVGGSAKEGEIILQGNQRDKCALYFKEKGFKTKNVGS